MQHRGLIGVLAAGLGLVLALWWGAGDDPAPPVASPMATPSAAPPRAPGPAPPEEAEPPAAHRGTDVDGHLARDRDGRFLPTPDALRLFDYFYLARGETPDAEIEARIEREIRRRLPPGEAESALALFADYLEYRERARRMHESGAAPVDLERRLQWIRELRREVFGAEVAAALFEEREALDFAALERRRIRADTSLSEDEKRARIEAVDARLPPGHRATRQRLQAPLRLSQEVEALRESGADEAEVFAARESRFGHEAALRLEALDRERAEWQARLDAYRTERDALLATQQESAEIEAALEALRAEHFTPEETRRVRALDAS